METTYTSKSAGKQQIELEYEKNARRKISNATKSKGRKCHF